jgi:hypothetical protein
VAGHIVGLQAWAAYSPFLIKPHGAPQTLDGFGRTFAEFYLAERFQQPLGVLG